VAERGVTLGLLERDTAQRDPVVEHAVVADLGGLADHHAHAVVDEEPATDTGAGVDLDPSEESRELTEYARHDPSRPAAGPYAVGQAVEPDRVEPRVDDRVLDVSPGGRVVRTCRGEVLAQ